MNDFSVKKREVEKVSVVHLKGYLDAHTAPDFEKALQDLVDQERVQIVVNLAELNYISSAGLGVFMGFIEEIRKKKGDIKIAEPSEKVYRVFDLLGFPVLYEIFPSESEAVEKYKKS